jgi:hypothetical protein
MTARKIVYAIFGQSGSAPPVGVVSESLGMSQAML